MIKTLIDTSKLKEYELNDFKEAEALLHEVEVCGWTLCQLVHDDENNKVHAMFEDNGKLFNIAKDLNRNIHIHSHPYIHSHVQNISSYARSEIYKKYKTENMKVLSKNKIQREIDAMNAINAEMKEANEIAKNKVATFMETIKDMSFIMSNDGKSGHIEKNGIDFSFEIGQDGYISKKLDLNYRVHTSLEAFIALSDNKYTDEK